MAMEFDLIPKGTLVKEKRGTGAGRYPCEPHSHIFSAS